MGLFNKDTAAPPSYEGGGNHGGYNDNKGQQFEQPPPQMNMGGPSQPPALYAALLLSSSDKIRLLNFPNHLWGVMTEIVTRAWPPGIQASNALEYGGYEFKLRGRPWYGQGSEAVPARRLLIHVFHGLAAQGWHLAASLDCSKKGYDKDTLFFRAGPAIQRMFFSVSMNEYDKIRLIDSPNDQVKIGFMNAIASWPQGVQDRKEKEHGCYQIKLKGYPWMTSNGQQVSHARILIIQLLTVMDNLGYELAASVDMSVGTGDDHADIDSLFFASKI